MAAHLGRERDVPCIRGAPRVAWDARSQGGLYARDGVRCGTPESRFRRSHGVTKAAALSFFEWLAITHGGEGIRVSLLWPQGGETGILGAQPPVRLRLLNARG